MKCRQSGKYGAENGKGQKRIVFMAKGIKIALYRLSHIP
jgi:hypothetical protein